jgi:transposase InsO family protein
MRFVFMLAEKAFPVRWMCKHLEVSCSGFYAWRSRPESEHTRRDRVLGVCIAAVHSENRGVYGSPRIYDELQADGEAVSKKRVARLMREKGLTGKAPRRFRRTTDSSHGLPVVENIWARNFAVDSPNEVWVGDITYVRTWEGWLYVAVVCRSNVDFCAYAALRRFFTSTNATMGMSTR